MQQKFMNYMSDSRAEFVIPALPNVTYTIVDFNLPAINLAPARQSTPFVDIPFQGDKPVYDTLSLNFLVDERLENWQEFHNWIRALAYPKEFSEYASKNLTSVDCTLTIYDSHNNAIMKITFLHCVPTRLGDLDLTSRSNDTNNVICNVQMEYMRYDIEVL